MSATFIASGLQQLSMMGYLTHVSAPVVPTWLIHTTMSKMSMTILTLTYMVNCQPLLLIPGNDVKDP